VGLISDRIHQIQGRVQSSAKRSALAAGAVTIIAVTKHHPAAAVDAVAEAGLLDVGENRVQEAISKAPGVLAPVRWHLIGHLQRNKVNKALQLFGTIHSVDSPRLVDVLGAAARPIDIFLQCNVSGESTKSGVGVERAGELLRSAARYPTIRVLGLMTMAPYSDDPEDARPCFRMLRELREDLNRLGVAPPMRALSMGMSGDFEVAVEEGATHLRIGSAILT
jgi:pyridoxal phosphate enzyme (YggS family)